MNNENALVKANVPNEDMGQEIDLIELWFRLLESWKLILVVTILFAVGAFAVTKLFITPIYVATAQLYVLSPGDSVINLSDLQIGSSLTKDYLEVFKTWEVNEQVAKNLSLSYTTGQLQGMLTVTNPADTRILKISINSPKPREAMDIANEFAKVAQEYISFAMSAEKPSVLSAAKLPTAPSSPSTARNVMLGFMLGLLASGGYVAVRFILDDKIKTADDLRRYANLATLAIIPLGEPAETKIKSAPARAKPSARSMLK